MVFKSGGWGKGRGRGGGGVVCMALLCLYSRPSYGWGYTTAGFTSVDRPCWLNGTGWGLVLGLVPDSRIFGLVN
jgi:hypothetical protein